MKFAIVLCFLTIVYSAPYNPELDNEWDLFKKNFGKNYNVEEEGVRRLIWEQNVDSVVKHNLQHELGKYNYTLGLNEYSDLTDKEFTSLMTSNKMPTRNSEPLATFMPPSNEQYPETVDWRNHGMVTPVKNQGLCGSCWAFSTTGSLEGQHKKKTGKLVSLSEQNLVDCSKNGVNTGCNEGSMTDSFQYIIKNGGIDTEASYPYEAKEGVCRFNPNTIGATVKGYVVVKSGDEIALKKAVATVGPISVRISLENSFRSYSGGIYRNSSCIASSTYHAILVVGYGTENGQDYWLVKNSWGESWGMKGYIKMARNDKDLCEISDNASYPVV